MTLTAGHFKSDTTSLPTQFTDLGVCFVKRAVGGVKDGLPKTDRILMLPHREALADPLAVGPEPRWNHSVCGVGLEAETAKW